MERTGKTGRRQRFGNRGIPSSEARYRSLFEGVPIGLYITTEDGRILDANPELVRMLRYPSKEELLGIDASELYANPSDREAELEILRDRRTLHSFETQLRRFDGQTIWVRDTCHAIYSEEGDIVYHEGSLQDITEEKEAEERLLFMARHDPLTGVYNRYALGEMLDREASRAQRYRHPIGVLMVDVNRLKETNDRFGHATGDEVLKRVAVILVECVRESDIVVRYGGDEFLVVLVETNGETDIVRDRIRDTVIASNPLHPTIDFPITLSIGVAHWDPDSQASLEETLSEADHAMYRDKRKFREREHLRNLEDYS